MAASRGAVATFAALVAAALGITGSWGPLNSWPALLLRGRAKAPGFGFVNAFASWCAWTRPGRGGLHEPRALKGHVRLAHDIGFAATRCM